MFACAYACMHVCIQQNRDIRNCTTSRMCASIVDIQQNRKIQKCAKSLCPAYACVYMYVWYVHSNPWHSSCVSSLVWMYACMFDVAHVLGASAIYFSTRYLRIMCDDVHVKEIIRLHMMDRVCVSLIRRGVYASD
jgi:hypothetical protein